MTSKIFDGKDPGIRTPINVTRTVQAYVPARYQDGTPAPVLFIQDGPGDLNAITYALDNLTVSTDPMRKLPPFVAVAIPNPWTKIMADRNAAADRGRHMG